MGTRVIQQLGRLDQTLTATPTELGVAEFRAALDAIVYYPED